MAGLIKVRLTLRLGLARLRARRLSALVKRELLLRLETLLIVLGIAVVHLPQIDDAAHKVLVDLRLGLCALADGLLGDLDLANDDGDVVEAEAALERLELVFGFVGAWLGEGRLGGEFVELAVLSVGEDTCDGIEGLGCGYFFVGAAARTAAAAAARRAATLEEEIGNEALDAGLLLGEGARGGLLSLGFLGLWLLGLRLLGGLVLPRLGLLRASRLSPSPAAAGLPCLKTMALFGVSSRHLESQPASGETATSVVVPSYALLDDGVELRLAVLTAQVLIGASEGKDGRSRSTLGKCIGGAADLLDGLCETVFLGRRDDPGLRVYGLSVAHYVCKGNVEEAAKGDYKTSGAHGDASRRWKRMKR